MATTSTVLRASDLPSRQLSALKHKASTLGLTPTSYVKKLIANDLALDRRARSMSFDDLAAPFRKAFHGVSEDEIDRVVDTARADYRKRSSRRGR